MRKCRSLFALMVGFILVAPASAQVILEKVAEVGEPAPGGGPGFVFEDFGTHPLVEAYLGASLLDRPLIDRRGNVTLHAFIGDDGIPDDDFFSAGHVYRSIGGQLDWVAGVGDPVPGLDAQFTFFPSIFPETAEVHDGRVTFLATIEGFDTGTRVFTDRFGALKCRKFYPRPGHRGNARWSERGAGRRAPSSDLPRRTADRRARPIVVAR